MNQLFDDRRFECLQINIGICDDLVTEVKIRVVITFDKFSLDAKFTSYPVDCRLLVLAVRSNVVGRDAE